MVSEPQRERLELKSRIFKSLFQKRMLKSPVYDFCTVIAATAVLRCV